MTGATVLVVDDEESVLRSMEAELRALGHNPIAVSDPGQVLDVAEREHPGVLLQDLRMKGLNLAGLVASLRSNPKTADIPIVFFSASPDIATVAARYDAWGYLRKPFSEAELVQVLERALGARFTPAEKKAATREPVQRDIRSMFHDYWNLLSALNSYMQALSRSPGLGPADQQIVQGLESALVKLESKTDRLQSLLETVVV